MVPTDQPPRADAAPSPTTSDASSPDARPVPAPTPAPSFEPELAALVAGVGLAALDLTLLAGGASRASVALLGTALAVTVFGAGLLAVAARIGLLFARALHGGTRAALGVGTILGLPVVLPIAVLLFRGTGISTRPWARWGPFVAAPLLLALVLLGAWLATHLARRARGRRLRLVLLPPLLGAAAALAWADRVRYPNQYGYLHWALLLATALALMAAGWVAVVGARTPRRARWLAPALLFAALPGFVVAAGWGIGSYAELRLFAERTHAAGRLAAVARALVDFDGDHHSIIFGEHDCDNSDPRVHPFALEIPGNGIDEDCDGVDEPVAPARPAASATLDAAGYRRALARWRVAPGLAARLRRSAPLSVVLLVVDALRADQLVDSAANRREHPRLLRLLDESRRFTRAYSTGAGTDIGMATIFTGQLHAFEAAADRGLLATYRAAGVHTHGVFQREVERWVGKQFSLAGLAGRKVLVNDPHRRDVGDVATSHQVTDQGIRFLRQRAALDSGRFFLWLHYFDVHEHHQVDPRRLPADARALCTGVARGLPFYRCLVRFVDREIGRLLDALDESGLRQRTFVVLVSDHGEGLAEHPRLPANHGDVLFEPLVHVPLALRLPGVPGGAVDAPVSVADLYPTLLDLSGIAAPPTDGLSLVPFLFGGHEAELAALRRPILMYEARQQAIIRWPYKFIAWQDQGLVELYDLGRDPAEEHNLVDAQPRLARELARELQRHKLPVIDRLAKRKP